MEKKTQLKIVMIHPYIWSGSDSPAYYLSLLLGESTHLKIPHFMLTKL